jgi:protein gp37
MGETSIQWADYTFNPWVGCQRVSPGCENCYAEAYDKRVGGAIDPADGVKKKRWGPTAPRIRTSVENWKKPLQWERKAAFLGERKRVFCSSLADVFEDRAELFPWRSDLFDLIDATPHLDWLLLTKRPENLPLLMPEQSWGKRNIWLGTTVEDPLRCERIAQLQRVPAAVRFLSCEPLISELRGLNLSGIDWVIIGGESGGKARSFDVAWARSLMKQCRKAGAAPFVKQLGSNVRDRNDAGFEAEHDVLDDGSPAEPGEWPTPKRIEEIDTGYQGAPVRVHLRDRAGGDPAEWPLDLRVREFPEVRR